MSNQKIAFNSPEECLLSRIAQLEAENAQLKLKTKNYEDYIILTCEGSRCVKCGFVVDGQSVIHTTAGAEEFPCCSLACAQKI